MAYGKGPIKTGKGGKELPPVEATPVKQGKKAQKLKLMGLKPVRARTIDPSKKRKPVLPKRPGGR